MSGKRCRQKRKQTYKSAALDAHCIGFVQGKRETGAQVTVNTILQAANNYLRSSATLQHDLGQSSITTKYVRNWMKRCHFKLKAVKKRSKLTEEEVYKKTQSLLVHVFRVLPWVDMVMNFDEVPMSLSGSMSGNIKTVTGVEDTAVKCNICPGDFKRCATLIIFVAVVRDGDGWKEVVCEPILLLKGEPKSENLQNEKYCKGIRVAWTKKGVITSTAMADVVIPHTKAIANGRRALCIMDAASSHNTAAMVNSFAAHDIHCSVIPAGLTSWMQWVDTHGAARYRSLHFEQYRPFAGIPKSAGNKRQLLAKICAKTAPMIQDNVVNQFLSLGYTNPAACRLRDHLEFRFVPPEVSADKKKEDGEKLKEAYEKAGPLHKVPQLLPRHLLQ